MARATAVSSHLPPLYREGELITALTELFGVELDMLDEAAASVQRAHWFGSTPDFDEAVALAALLDIGPESFHQNIGEFRAWVHALRDARLRGGAVTREALRILVDTYSRLFQRADNIDAVPPIAEWASTTDDGHAALIENPRRIRRARLPVTGGLEPLIRLTVTNRGLDPAPWAVVVTGLAGGSEFAPFLANRATGHAIVYRGEVAVGARLTIAPSAADREQLRALLDGVDVSDRLDVYPALVPGPDGPGSKSESKPAGLLGRGDNEFWFLPLAHYDTPGLDRFLMALADDALRMGRFDQTEFDHSLFAQRPQVAATVEWLESVPATLEVELPGRAMRSLPGAIESAIDARERLVVGLDVAVEETAAAGVDTAVTMPGFQERQPSRDRLAHVFPQTIREIGPSGADRIAEGLGAFDLTDFDDSTLT